MSWWSDLLKGIPLNEVLRERLALAEQKFRDLEDENNKLKDRVAALTAENKTLQGRVAEAQAKEEREKAKPELMYGCYFFGGDCSKLYCVACYETQGKKHPMSPVRHIGHQCTVCQKMVYR